MEEHETINESSSITVALRIKPTLYPSGSKGFINVSANSKLSFLGCRSVIDVIPQNSIKIDKRKIFSFDQVFGPNSTQASIFNSNIKELLNNFTQGYNASVLCYGQTNSGKSYTMGTLPNTSNNEILDGLIPRCSSYIFQKLNEDTESQYQMTCSFLEIYNEDLLDLLNQPTAKEKRTNPNWYQNATQQVQIRETPSGQITCTGAKEIVVESKEELLHLLHNGLESRTTALTDLNGYSSRSHAIFSLNLRQNRWIEDPYSEIDPITKRKTGDWQILFSKIHFVDLAGSERLKRTNAVGDRQREGISINSGLLALGNVIFALSDEKAAHIPYRESKLTRLLQDSLGGNSKTLMIACVSEAFSDMAETLNTLNYANRTRNIKNVAVKNFSYDSEVSAMKEQIKLLKEELSSWQNTSKNEEAFQKLEDSKRENILLKQQVALLIQSKNDLRHQYEYVSNDLALIQSENTYRLLSSPLPAESIGEFMSDTESVISNTTISSIPVPSRLKKKESESDKANKKLKIELREITGAAQTYLSQIEDLELQLAKAHETHQNASTRLLEMEQKLFQCNERERVTEAYVLELEDRLNMSTNLLSKHTNLIAELKEKYASVKGELNESEDYILGLEKQLANREELENVVQLLEMKLNNSRNEIESDKILAHLNINNFKCGLEQKIDAMKGSLGESNCNILMESLNELFNEHTNKEGENLSIANDSHFVNRESVDKCRSASFKVSSSDEVYSFDAKSKLVQQLSELETKLHLCESKEEQLILDFNEKLESEKKKCLNLQNEFTVFKEEKQKKNDMELEEWKALLESKTVALKNLEAEFKILEMEKVEIKTKALELEDDTKFLLEEKTAEIEILKDNLLRTEAQNFTFQSIIGENKLLKKQLNELNQIQSVLTLELEILKKDLSEKNVTIKKSLDFKDSGPLLTEVTELKNEVEKLKTNLETCKMQEEKFKADKKKSNGLYVEITKELEILKKEKQAIQKQFNLCEIQLKESMDAKSAEEVRYNEEIIQLKNADLNKSAIIEKLELDLTYCNVSLVEKEKNFKLEYSLQAEDLEKLKIQATALEKQINERISELNTAQNKCTSLENDIVKLTEEKSILEVELNLSAGEFKKLTLSCKALKKMLENSINFDNCTFPKKEDMNYDELNSLVANFKILEVDIPYISSICEVLIAQLNDTLELKSNFENLLNTSEEKLNAAVAENLRLNTQLNLCSIQLQELEVDENSFIKKPEVNSTIYKMKLDSMENTNSRVTNQKGSIATELETLQQYLLASEEKKSNLLNEANVREVEIKVLREKILNSEDIINLNTITLEKLQTENSSLLTVNAQLKEEKKVIEGKFAELEHTHKNCETEAIELRCQLTMEIEKLEKKVSESEAINPLLSKDGRFDKETTQIKQLEEELKSLHEINIDLNKKLSISQLNKEKLSVPRSKAVEEAADGQTPSSVSWINDLRYQKLFNENQKLNSDLESLSLEVNIQRSQVSKYSTAVQKNEETIKLLKQQLENKELELVAAIAQKSEAENALTVFKNKLNIIKGTNSSAGENTKEDTVTIKSMWKKLAESQAIQAQQKSTIERLEEKLAEKALNFETLKCGTRGTLRDATDSEKVSDNLMKDYEKNFQDLEMQLNKEKKRIVDLQLDLEAEATKNMNLTKKMNILNASYENSKMLHITGTEKITNLEKKNLVQEEEINTLKSEIDELKIIQEQKNQEYLQIEASNKLIFDNIEKERTLLLNDLQNCTSENKELLKKQVELQKLVDNGALKCQKVEKLLENQKLQFNSLALASKEESNKFILRINQLEATLESEKAINRNFMEENLKSSSIFKDESEISIIKIKNLESALEKEILKSSSLKLEFEAFVKDVKIREKELQQDLTNRDGLELKVREINEKFLTIQKELSFKYEVEVENSVLKEKVAKLEESLKREKENYENRIVYEKEGNCLLEEFEIKMTAKNEEVKSLKTKLAALEEDLNLKNAKLDQLHHELEISRANVKLKGMKEGKGGNYSDDFLLESSSTANTVTKTIENLTMKLENEINYSLKRKAEYEDIISNLNKKLSDSIARNKNDTIKIENLQHFYNNLKNELNNINKDSKVNLKDLKYLETKDKIFTLEKKLNDANEKISLSLLSEEAKNKEIASITKENVNLGLQLDRLQSGCNSLQETIDSQEQLITKLEIELHKLQSNDQEIGSQNNKEFRLTTKIDKSVGPDFVELSSQRKSFEVRKSMEVSNVSSDPLGLISQAEFLNLRSTIDKLVQQIEVKQDEINRTRYVSQSLQYKIQELSRNNERLSVELKKLEAERKLTRNTLPRKALTLKQSHHYLGTIYIESKPNTTRSSVESIETDLKPALNYVEASRADDVFKDLPAPPVNLSLDNFNNNTIDSNSENRNNIPPFVSAKGVNRYKSLPDSFFREDAPNKLQESSGQHQRSTGFIREIEFAEERNKRKNTKFFNRFLNTFKFRDDSDGRSRYST
ncbi:Kinesin-like protein kif21b [Lobulomyces angularis]|nr:Kinesin-like protein kif21b [Lobulomyces angularis]